MTRGEKAKANFLSGYNCTQSVLLAFDDVIKKDDLSLLVSSASGFGGGIGRLREVCGTFSAGVIILGYFFGYDKAEEKEKKALLYSYIQDYAERFEKENGSIVCRELLGLGYRRDNPVPEERNSEYYRKRPCAVLSEKSAVIIENFLIEKGILQSRSTASEILR